MHTRQSPYIMPNNWSSDTYSKTCPTLLHAKIHSFIHLSLLLEPSANQATKCTSYIRLTNFDFVPRRALLSTDGRQDCQTYLSVALDRQTVLRGDKSRELVLVHTVQGMKEGWAKEDPREGKSQGRRRDALVRMKVCMYGMDSIC